MFPNIKHASEKEVIRMTNAILIMAVLGAGLYGYWLMSRLDGFLREQVKGEMEEDDQPQQE